MNEVRRAISDIYLVHFTGTFTDPKGEPGDLSEEQYHAARNVIVRVCRAFGRVGPLGEYRGPDSSISPQYFDDGDENPDFFVVDDQLNYTRHILVGIFNADVLTADWLVAIDRELSRMPGWFIDLRNLRDVAAFIFPSVMLVSGKPVRKCRSVKECLERLRNCVERE